MTPRIGCAPLNWSTRYDGSGRTDNNGWTNSVGEDHDGIQQMIGAR